MAYKCYKCEEEIEQILVMDIVEEKIFCESCYLEEVKRLDKMF